MISSVGQYTNNLTMTMTIKTSKSNSAGAVFNLVSKELTNERIAFSKQKLLFPTLKRHLYRVMCNMSSQVHIRG
jgi:hypothetical protein